MLRVRFGLSMGAQVHGGHSDALAFGKVVRDSLGGSCRHEVSAPVDIVSPGAFNFGCHKMRND